MRVLFQTYALAFQSPGGGERVILELQKALTLRGHEVALYQPWEHDPAAFDVLHYFSVLESAHWRHLKRHHPDKPLFVTPTLFVGKGRRDRWRLHKERILSWLRPGRYSDLQLPDHFFPNTAYEASTLERQFRVPKAKITVLPNGVSEHFRLGHAEPFRNFSGLSGPFVLHVGRFHPVKQQDFLIEALRDTKVQCVFIGDEDVSHSSYRAHCMRLAADSKENNFHFFKGIGANDPLLSLVYAAAGLFALPSQFETFGIAALEAAVAGCPLLLSDKVADSSVFQGAGTLLPITNAALWRAAILRHMESGRERLSPSIVAKLQSSYDWSLIARSLEQEYLRLSFANRAQ